MINKNLRDILQTGQFYVVEARDKFGINVKAIKHEVATDTCFEKADLLGWDFERIVKAVFFHKKDISYGLIFPELGERDFPSHITKEIISEVFNITKTQAKKFKNSYCPNGMEYGTCTPFILEDSFEKGLERIFIYDYPELNNKLVDISIGGEGEEAHKISLHLKYEDIYKILKYQFGDRIEKFNNI
jgi:hypothetical protein